MGSSSFEVAQQALREREPTASLLWTRSWAHWRWLAEIPPRWWPLVTVGVVVVISPLAVAAAYFVAGGETERDRWLNALPLGLIVGALALFSWLSFRLYPVLMCSEEGLRRGPILAQGAGRVEAVSLLLASVGAILLLGISDRDRTGESIARTLFSVAAACCAGMAFGRKGMLRTIDRAGRWIIHGPLIRWSEIERIEFEEWDGRITLVVVRNKWSSDPGRSVRIRLANRVAEIDQVRAALEPYRRLAQAA